MLEWASEGTRELAETLINKIKIEFKGVTYKPLGRYYAFYRGKQIGEFLRPTAWQCPRCKRIFCGDCCPEIGLIFKKPICPECKVELFKG
ncbi:MAG: hypothetical protein ABIM42_06740 [candidate division WOR-3 bacterium]